MTDESERAFLDSNILLYTLELGGKADIAEQVLESGYAISVQVLNEFANAARRKGMLSAKEIVSVEARFRRLFVVLPLTLETHDLAIKITDRYGFSFYDSLIVASALDAGCTRLFTEDMQHGQLLDKRLRVINPFV